MSEDLDRRAEELALREEQTRFDAGFAEQKLDECKAIERAIDKDVDRETLLRHVGEATHDFVRRITAAYVFWEPGVEVVRG